MLLPATYHLSPTYIHTIWACGVNGAKGRGHSCHINFVVFSMLVACKTCSRQTKDASVRWRGKGSLGVEGRIAHMRVRPATYMSA